MIDPCEHGVVGYCETCALSDPGELGERKPQLVSPYKWQTLCEAVTRLHGLCIDPQPGLATWNECLHRAKAECANAIAAYEPLKEAPSATLPSLFLTAVCEELFGCFMTPAENGIFRCACCDWPIDLRNWVDAEHDGGCLIPRVRNYLAKHKPECVKTQYVNEKETK